MAEDLEKIGIRSNKIRNIMLKKPPIVIRYGTVFIVTLLLAMAIMASYVIK